MGWNKSWLLVLALVAGCANPHVKKGEDLARAGDLDGAVEAYRKAEIAEPGNRRISERREDAERAAADAHYARALEEQSAGNIPATIEHLETALQLFPALSGAREQLERANRKRVEVREMMETGHGLLKRGDPIAAHLALTPALAYKAGFPEIEPLHEQARRGAVAALRERAQKKLAAGDVAAANADLE